MSKTGYDLVGAWRLESWSFDYDDGRQEFPLGAGARGMLLYTPSGQVSATLMGATSMHAEQSHASLAYAGRYEQRDGSVHHSIEIATEPSLVGLTTTRYIAQEGDMLTLSGPDFRADTGRSQKIVWRRLS